ncbi:unnamed protein product [Caenorhabditis sp. 36 PRJEB53466]|nr:unnamed protein product [Caenorhabditis sp. 36 PRJEB53466]
MMNRRATRNEEDDDPEYNPRMKKGRKSTRAPRAQQPKRQFGVVPPIEVRTEAERAKDLLLLKAIENMSSREVLALLEDGASPNARSSNGNPAINLAVIHCSRGIVGHLLGAGANPSSCNYSSETPAHLCVRSLYRRNAKGEVRPAFVTRERDLIEIFDKLVTKGADIKKTDHWGFSVEYLLNSVGIPCDAQEAMRLRIKRSGERGSKFAKLKKWADAFFIGTRAHDLDEEEEEEEEEEVVVPPPKKMLEWNVLDLEPLRQPEPEHILSQEILEHSQPELEQKDQHEESEAIEHLSQLSMEQPEQQQNSDPIDKLIDALMEKKQAIHADPELEIDQFSELVRTVATLERQNVQPELEAIAQNEPEIVLELASEKRVETAEIDVEIGSFVTLSDQSNQQQIPDQGPMEVDAVEHDQGEQEESHGEAEGQHPNTQEQIAEVRPEPQNNGEESLEIPPVVDTTETRQMLEEGPEEALDLLSYVAEVFGEHIRVDKTASAEDDERESEQDENAALIHAADPDPDPEPEPEVEPEVEAEVEPEVEAEPKVEAEPEIVPDPEVEAESQPEPELIPDSPEMIPDSPENEAVPLEVAKESSVPQEEPAPPPPPQPQFVPSESEPNEAIDPTGDPTNPASMPLQLELLQFHSNPCLSQPIIYSDMMEVIGNENWECSSGAFSSQLPSPPEVVQRAERKRERSGEEAGGGPEKKTKKKKKKNSAVQPIQFSPNSPFRPFPQTDSNSLLPSFSFPITPSPPVNTFDYPQLPTAGANVFAKCNSRYTALHEAVLYCQPRMVYYLLKAKANHSDHSNSLQESPLHICIRNLHIVYNRDAKKLAFNKRRAGLLKIFKMLINAGADVRQKDKWSYSPLHLLHVKEDNCAERIQMLKYLEKKRGRHSFFVERTGKNGFQVGSREGIEELGDELGIENESDIEEYEPEGFVRTKTPELPDPNRKRKRKLEVELPGPQNLLPQRPSVEVLALDDELEIVRMETKEDDPAEVPSGSAPRAKRPREEEDIDLDGNVLSIPSNQLPSSSMQTRQKPVERAAISPELQLRIVRPDVLVKQWNETLAVGLSSAKKHVNTESSSDAQTSSSSDSPPNSHDLLPSFDAPPARPTSTLLSIPISERTETTIAEPTSVRSLMAARDETLNRPKPRAPSPQRSSSAAPPSSSKREIIKSPVPRRSSFLHTRRTEKRRATDIDEEEDGARRKRSKSVNFSLSLNAPEASPADKRSTAHSFLNIDVQLIRELTAEVEKVLQEPRRAERQALSIRTAEKPKSENPIPRYLYHASLFSSTRHPTAFPLSLDDFFRTDFEVNNPNLFEGIHTDSMKYQVETQALPYSTIILHCLKYPAKGVFGLLIGNKKGDKVTVTGCVPLCHESTPLAPPLELATSLVHGKYGASLVGVYFSNATPSETSLSPFAIRLAERISAVTSSAAVLIQVMNEKLVADCDQDRLVAYEKDGESWKETKTIFQGSNFLKGLQAVIQKKLYRELADFENHLDNPDSDFYNTNLSNKLVQVAEFRA